MVGESEHGVVKTRRHSIYRMYRFHRYRHLLHFTFVDGNQILRSNAFPVVLRRNNRLSRIIMRFPYATLSFRVGRKTVQQVRNQS